MRRLGLGLALAVVCKIFLIDFWRLTEGYRIITYFALGVALLGISFVYQLFTKKLDNANNTGDTHSDVPAMQLTTEDD